MSLPKAIIFISISLFLLIGVLAMFKKSSSNEVNVATDVPVEIELKEEMQTVTPALVSQFVKDDTNESLANVFLPEEDRITELFTVQGSKLPIVETVTYKSHVSWQKGRPAWLSDYASHYQTSRHFIARSLNGNTDYFKQEVSEGDQFNVLKKDKNLQFYLVVDTSRCKLWLYSLDPDDQEKILLKTYSVGLGRLDPSKTSGLLTPLGKYSLGDKVVIYKPKNMGVHQNQKIEMMSVFGTRWIPFEKEIGSCTAPARGFGLHGTPWIRNSAGELVDSASGIGKYESDGCIRLSTPDIEEIFSIIITKPTTIEIVRDFRESAMY